MSYKDSYHPKIKSDLKKIDISASREIKAVHLDKILNNPYAAEQLYGNLAGVWSYHFRKNNVDYRISYSIDETQKAVYFLMIGKRENFYEILRRRLA
jgi:addiction module RelE/StbE family toxin